MIEDFQRSTLNGVIVQGNAAVLFLLKLHQEIFDPDLLLCCFQGYFILVVFINIKSRIIEDLVITLQVGLIDKDLVLPWLVGYVSLCAVRVLVIGSTSYHGLSVFKYLHV